MLLAHHAAGRMCVTSTVFFFLILPASSESFVQRWIATKPVELGCLEGKLLPPIHFWGRQYWEFSRDRKAVESGHHPKVLSLQSSTRWWN